MLFWIAAIALTAGCTAIVIAAFRTPPEVAAPDVEVYRDQLAELDRDRARGTLTEAEAEAARAEVARRLLAADKAAQAATAGFHGNGWIGAGLAVVLVVAVTLATYLTIGAPGYGDMPLQTRISAIEENRAARAGQAAAEAEVPNQIDTSRPDVTAMAQQLRDVLKERPDDLRGWRLAAQTEAGLGDMEAAWRAQTRVIEILGDEATANDYASLAELMILAAGGYVSPEAERALEAALTRDSSHGLARFYLGSMYAQGGRPDLAWPVWRRLVADSTPDAPWLPVIYARIEAISQAAGDPTPLDQLPRPRGPSAEDIEAAGEMTMEERVQMIEGMISGLAARLASDGGPVEDWARLITAYGVSGNLNAAVAVYNEAILVFEGNQGALDMLAQAADRAGFTP
ncbi:c-type cytochrome biogenesis protein CcmI [Jannaschia seohaensis]|uniref:Cytochrome c-type biogenesis protein CcmH n=1 Tax=Jannaschia seohaensis TaxID=475081 RepID=A0A2Y9AZJ5_9RHOB|nr:c-type cytochrome biogenesis protein CcmI [Jannaschia seohaensis]PWJ15842.1 cytochrome c-type biogenesis protein CcmH [Jannaschia seohaensis]SSA49546.1 cytochrome c-type biogenesis protein CcmH [Jannaschia seohaensis]